MQEPARVLITGAAGQIGYIISHWVAAGTLYDERPVILHLLDIPPAENRLKALEMELIDCAFPQLAGIVATTSYDEAFKDIDCAFLVASFPLRPGEVRADLLKNNASIFKATGLALGKYAKPTVKVLTIGNPDNSNTQVALDYASPLTAKNFSSLSMLDHNRSVYELASKFGVSVDDVHDMIVWGNHAETQVPDLTHAWIEMHGKKIKVLNEVGKDYIRQFVEKIASRAWAIRDKRGFTSAASPSKAAIQHMRAWLYGTKEGEVLSMGIPVPDNEPYGIKKGIVFSFPCTVDKEGNIHVKEDYPVNDWLARHLKITEDDLFKEKSIAQQVLAEKA